MCVTKKNNFVPQLSDSHSTSFLGKRDRDRDGGEGKDCQKCQVCDKLLVRKVNKERNTLFVVPCTLTDRYTTTLEIVCFFLITIFWAEKLQHAKLTNFGFDSAAIFLNSTSNQYKRFQKSICISDYSQLFTVITNWCLQRKSVQRYYKSSI